MRQRVRWSVRSPQPPARFGEDPGWRCAVTTAFAADRCGRLRPDAASAAEVATSLLPAARNRPFDPATQPTNPQGSQPLTRSPPPRAGCSPTLSRRPATSCRCRAAAGTPAASAGSTWPGRLLSRRRRRACCWRATGSRTCPATATGWPAWRGSAVRWRSSPPASPAWWSPRWAWSWPATTAIGRQSRGGDRHRHHHGHGGAVPSG